MVTQKKLESKRKVKLDFTKPELLYILENANFTEEEEEIFRMLTGRQGRQTIVYISFKMNMSESTVKRRIRKIKDKIKRLL